MNIENLLNSRNDNDKRLGKINKGSLKSQTSGYIEPDKEKSFKLYNEDVKISKKLYEHEFTNFLTKNQLSNLKDLFRPYIDDLDKLRECQLDEDRNGSFDIRLKEIFNLYLNKDNFSYNQINKIRIETDYFSHATSLRLFIFVEKDHYKLFLIDPLHLVIPSKVQKDKKTFKTNKGNSCCMSEIWD